MLAAASASPTADAGEKHCSLARQSVDGLVERVGRCAPSLRSPQSGEFASLVTALHTGFIADVECGDKNRRFGLARSAGVGDGVSACD